MSITQQILSKLDALPEAMQREVLDFAEFLKHRQQADESSTKNVDVSRYVDNEEHRALGQAGAAHASRSLPSEDFSDWPGFRREERSGNG